MPQMNTYKMTKLSLKKKASFGAVSKIERRLNAKEEELGLSSQSIK